MYCSNCGYHLKEKEIEKVKDANNGTTRNASSKDVYVCPRCNKIIKNDLNEEEVKALARASHSEIHRARNLLNTGKSFLVVGTILIIISLLFLTLSFKSNNYGKFEPNCTEFYTFCGLMAIGLFMVIFGAISFVRGFKKRKEYEEVLKDIQNEVFYQ